MQREVLGYLQALPDASHFIATPDHQAVALWHLLPDETPRNEFWAGWQRIFKVEHGHARCSAACLPAASGSVTACRLLLLDLPEQGAMMIGMQSCNALALLTLGSASANHTSQASDTC